MTAEEKIKEDIKDFLEKHEMSILAFCHGSVLARSTINNILREKTKSIRLSTIGKIKNRMREIEAQKQEENK